MPLLVTLKDDPMRGTALNQQIADRLSEAAELLEQQEANPFRIRAYRRAAETVVDMPEDIKALYDRSGSEGLESLPGIGPSLAAAIAEMLRTGRWAQLERIRGVAEPEKLFQSIPGVGPGLAQRIHETLHVDTLAALEIAAHDGRLEQVPGVGPRRAAQLRAALASMLARTRPRVLQSPTEPGVDMLLDVDREYRSKTTADSLPTIAPKRFNPEGKAWLPVLHAERGDWQFTALFSNTARAHEFDRIHDWVVIYFHTDAQPEGQRTVVTESRGELAGKRVVRGRESECRAYYQLNLAASGNPKADLTAE